MKLGFGKWGDSPIEDVPEDYLVWLQKNSQDKVDICKSELERRQSRFDNSWMVKIVQKGFIAVTVGQSEEDIVTAAKARDALMKAIMEAAQGAKP